MEDFNSKYSGEQVEALLDQVASGNAGGGGGGITVETDPVFSASPAASITEEKIAEWNSKSAQGEKGDKGDTGVGVQSVAQTTTSNVDGGSNVVTVTLSNGTTSTFNVKNGSKGSSGSNGTNGTNGKDGTDGVDGATFTPSVDSEGNLSWTNNKGLTNPPTVNIKGPKGDKGDDGEGGGSSGGTAEKEFVEVEVKNGTIIFGIGNQPNFEPNKVYYAKSPISDGLSIYSLIAPTEDIGEYNLHFSCSSGVGVFVGILEVPSNWLWANGEVPTLENNVSYELSVVATKFGDDFTYKAVLTSFK